MTASRSPRRCAARTVCSPASLSATVSRRRQRTSSCTSSRVRGMSAGVDALCAASEIVLAGQRAALDAGDTVATVGYLTVDPNQTNIVPGRVVLRIDLRSVDDARVDDAEGRA